MRVDKRPKNLSSWAKYKPATVTERENIVQKCGQACFLFPGGTGARPGVPAYPICATLERTGGRCILSCPGLEAAYKRLRMGIEHYTYPESYKGRMRTAAEKAIKLALPHADAADPTNTCNWALRASGSLEGRFEDMAKMRMNECRTTRRGIKYCRLPEGVRFVGGGGRARSNAYRHRTGSSGLSGPMKVGECRRTRNGVKYCRGRKGVRFRKG